MRSFLFRSNLDPSGVILGFDTLDSAIDWYYNTYHAGCTFEWVQIFSLLKTIEYK